jgi:hypothetical protein
MNGAGASTVLCVTGMHRSGTSFVASALRALGISLGDPGRLMRPGPDNPAGYYEVQSILDLNQEVLAHLGGAWDAPPVLDPGWENDPELAPFRSRALQILDDSFGTRAERPPLIAFKDPRLSLLLPLWRLVTPIATTIVLVRDPAEVAASLGARRYQVDGPQAAGLWLRYLFAATANDPGHMLVRYGDVFDDLPRTLRTIAAHLGIAAPDAAAEASALAQLDPSLRHYREPRSAASDDPLMAVARAVWNDGAVDLDLLPPAVTDALARGWLRPPVDSDLLARARATTVKLQETLRQRDRQLASLEANRAVRPEPEPREQPEG